MSCPPCTTDCNQGRTCPNRTKPEDQSDGLPWGGLLMVLPALSLLLIIASVLRGCAS